ncbi:MAG TPA: DNA repair protein RecN [Kofleriaceae bacterium]|nr:DNA repair protein RecN [Kofleriaceae bacterium]
MLRHLRVTNFAILSDVSLDLGPGLNVLTGETGAGKSLIVDAVNLLRGGRASADIPRAGSDEAVVEAIFEVPDDLRGRVRARLVEAGLPDGEEDGSLLVRRIIHRGGRSRVYVNGALTTASRLAELGELLVDLSGQHQHQGLVDARRHREILDEYAGHRELCEAMAAAWQRLHEIDQAIAEIDGGSARAERIDFLRFQLDEIAAADLQPGEDEELSRERARLASAERLESGARAAWELLYDGEGAAIERIDAAASELERLLAIDDTLREPARAVGEARALVEDAASRLRAYADRQGGDPERLAAVDDRLALIRRLTRKHGGSVDEVLARAGALRAELDGLEGAEGRRDELEAARAAALDDAEARAAALGRSRRDAAARLASEVGAALAELGMASASLEVAITARELGPSGADQVELMLCANRGEPAKPLIKVASGGELSRIMLALKLVLRRADPVATYVFDEVDAGIGGATAEVVGHKIREVSAHRQVLCVTHLPQIAALASRHVHVSKAEVDGRTETSVVALDAAARRDEIARMMGGRITAEARAHADALLAAAGGAAATRAATAPRKTPRGRGARSSHAR